MRQKRPLVNLNGLNHLRGQSTEISSVGFQTQRTILYRRNFDIWFRLKIIYCQMRLLKFGITLTLVISSTGGEYVTTIAGPERDAIGKRLHSFSLSGLFME